MSIEENIGGYRRKRLKKQSNFKEKILKNRYLNIKRQNIL